jgi:hydrogenase maturation factor
MAEAIFAQITAACRELGASLIGGHTEITHDLYRPIVAGCMLGEVAPERLVRPTGSRAGDSIILTKGIAIEGTAIIAREAVFAEGSVDDSVLGQAEGFLHDPGISVVRDAEIAAAAGTVHAFHDPTEGGLATGLWELAEAADVSFVVDQALVPIYPETRTLCQALDLDPLGLLASGALLLTAPPEDAPGIVSALRGEGVAAAVIGHVAAGPASVTLCGHGATQRLRRFPRDEIARLFG